MYQQVRRLGRRIAIALAGGLVVVAGVALAMPFVPGPGVLLILVGLGILSLEFERPRVWLAILKTKGRGAAQRLVRRRSRTDDAK
jgi:hypothetical protein